MVLDFEGSSLNRSPVHILHEYDITCNAFCESKIAICHKVVHGLKANNNCYC